MWAKADTDADESKDEERKRTQEMARPPDGDAIRGKGRAQRPAEQSEVSY